MLGIPSVDDFERMQEPPDPGNPPKRKYSLKAANGKKADQPAARKTSTKTNTLALSGAQLSKLYELLTGGQLIIGDDEYYVSRDSLDTVLPRLLEKL